jgi:hypothetical protein
MHAKRVDSLPCNEDALQVKWNPTEDQTDFIEDKKIKTSKRVFGLSQRFHRIIFW